LKSVWDQTFDGESYGKWTSWVMDFEDLTNLRFNRYFQPPGFGKIKDAQLHFFSDAAEKAGYGSVCYIRLVNEEGRMHVLLLFAKSRVLPLKPVSKTPRLELIAAVVAAKIAAKMKKELTAYNLSKVKYWTDSTIVLLNLRNLSARLPMFEANQYQ
jgi:hypothetical protein